MFKKLLCVFLSLLTLTAFGQSDSIQIITRKLEKFRKSFPQEKIHLHLDKPFYSIGDTVYFKAYVVNAEKNMFSAISNIIYIDLIDENDSIKRTIRRPITDGVAWGTIELSDSLPEGNYRIRSYTNWMRNFSEAYFFDQVIAVGNALTNDIMADAVFKSKGLKDKSSDTAIIHYKSMRGHALAGKEVSYTIFINKKEVQKGKGKTDVEGKLRLGFADIPSPSQQPAEMVTRVRLDNKTTITRVIKFKLPSAQPAIRFFPEGGKMVSGLPARIGFKAVSADGLGTSVAGKITDETSSEVVTFRSGFAGIGSFQFTPQPGHSYQAQLHYEDGSEEKKDLPKAEEYGYALATDNSDTAQVKINIASRLTTSPENVTVVVQCNNRIQYTATLPMDNGNASHIVSKKKFPTGIIQFTVVDAAMQPVAERLVFINHHDQLNITNLPGKTSYVTKEHVKMELIVKDNKGNPVAGNFSVSVTNGNAVAIDKTGELSILSDLLLTSDIRGYIESPNYYFTDIDNKKITDLDNLLLTQGWRRFIWKEILADKYPSTPYPAEKSLVISGKVVSAKGEPVADAKVTLLSKKGPGYMLDTLTTASGNFTFDEFDFEDDRPFVVMAEKGGNSNIMQIKLDNISPPPVTGNKNLFKTKNASATAIDSYLMHSVNRFDEMKKNGLLHDHHMLKEVVVNTRKLSKIQEAVAPSANLNGPGRADQIITYEDLRNCSELGQCLQGKLRGIIFKFVIDQSMDTRNKVYRLQPFSALGMGAPMLVILDGMDISASQGLDIRNIPAANVQSIEVLRSGAYLSTYGTRASGGILVITTKKGGIDYDADLKTNSTDNTKSNAMITTAKGYAVSRKFYSPDYSHPFGNSMPDMRSTIYWQPNLTTNEDGKAAIDFYNANDAGRYNVIIEGLSADGKPGRTFFTYDVK